MPLHLPKSNPSAAEGPTGPWVFLLCLCFCAEGRRCKHLQVLRTEGAKPPPWLPVARVQAALCLTPLGKGTGNAPSARYVMFDISTGPTGSL